MFATPQSLLKRTGKNAANRPAYLKMLVEEYKCATTSSEKKLQVLANLGNFSYDPINYEYFRRFNILELFLDNLKEFFERADFTADSSAAAFVHFSIAAVCNLCLDPAFKLYLIKQNIVQILSHYFLMYAHSRDHIEPVLSALTALIFLYNQESVQFELRNNSNFAQLLNELAQSPEKRLANLAELFLIDYLKIKSDP